jgi:biopolymer transport protein ExbD
MSFGVTPMKLRQRQTNRGLPDINLVPMLDVLMTVLTFFIVISMTMALDRGVDLKLPGRSPSIANPAKTTEPFIVQLSPTGITINAQTANSQTPNSQTVDEAMMLQQLQDYLAANPKGTVMLQVDPKSSYEQAIKLLSSMKTVGGERVTLALE